MNSSGGSYCRATSDPDAFRIVSIRRSWDHARSDLGRCTARARCVRAIWACIVVVVLQLASCRTLVAQERVLEDYDDGGTFEVGPSDHQRMRDIVAPAIRDFLWKHHEAGARGFVRLLTTTREGDQGTTVYFVEPDDRGLWVVTIEVSTGHDSARIQPSGGIRKSVTRYVVNGRVRAEGWKTSGEVVDRFENLEGRLYRLRLYELETNQELLL